MQTSHTRSGESPASPPTPTGGPEADGPSEGQAFVLRRLSDDSPVSVLRLADDAATELPEAPADATAAYYELVSAILPPLAAAGVVEFDRERRTVGLAERDAAAGLRLASGANWLAIAGPLAVLVLLGGMIGTAVPVGVGFLSVAAVAAAAGYLLRRRADADAADVTAAVTDSVPTDRRILELLLANGGRMKQQRIVESVDVSAASVSRHLSQLAEQDRIDKCPVGRENVVQLAGMGPLDDPDRRPRPE